jgi:hypothetical protein
MRKLALVLTTMLGVFMVSAPAQKVLIPNPSIDMKGYLKIANEAAEYREARRLTEDEFIKMSREPGVIILDARSKREI